MMKGRAMLHCPPSNTSRRCSIRGLVKNQIHVPLGSIGKEWKKKLWMNVLEVCLYWWSVLSRVWAAFSTITLLAFVEPILSAACVTQWGEKPVYFSLDIVIGLISSPLLPLLSYWLDCPDLFCRKKAWRIKKRCYGWKRANKPNPGIPTKALIYFHSGADNSSWGIGFFKATVWFISSAHTFNVIFFHGIAQALELPTKAFVLELLTREYATSTGSQI